MFQKKCENSSVAEISNYSVFNFINSSKKLKGFRKDHKELDFVDFINML